MDLSKLPDSQRQELEQLQKQFQEHQSQQLKRQQSAAAVQQPPPQSAYDPFQIHQPYNPPQVYDHSYYYNYQDPSQHHQQQSYQQYDASYYHNYYSNSYQQQQQYTHSETIPATAYAASNEQQRNIGLGQVQDPYGNQGNLGVSQPNLGYSVPPGLNPTAAAAVAALSHLTQFAGSMAVVERHNPVGHTSYRGGGRRGGGSFRGSGPSFHGRGRGGGRSGGRDRGARRRGSTVGSPSSQPESSARRRPRVAWCDVCKVDCTHVEMLDQHNNGRRHKKNLRLLQKKKSADQAVDPPVDQPVVQPVDPPADQPTVQPVDPPVVQPVDQPVVQPVDQPVVQPADQPVVQPVDPPVVQPVDQPTVQTEDSKLVSDVSPELPKNDLENKAGNETKTGDDNNNNTTVETKENDNQEKRPRMKRKMRDGVRGTGGPRSSRGSRRSRWRDGDKRMRPSGPRQIKLVIPLMCDLCNVKCDTQEVFNRHAAGKKHRAKLRKYQGHQAAYGATAVQALYPPNPLSQTLAPQPAYHGEPSAYPAPYEAYIPIPYQAQNPNPQLADAPLEFSTQTNASNGVQ